MSEIRLELPPDVHAEILRRAGSEPDADANWVLEAVREQLSACVGVEYLEARAHRGNREEFEKVLAKVPVAAPIEGDEWPPVSTSAK